ncbi:MAG: hypothetical protein NDI77_05145 [Geobacteraceae bacterium]|nr:hypothetical protein [Geobacteraceae bacterium]
MKYLELLSVSTALLLICIGLKTMFKHFKWNAVYEKLDSDFRDGFKSATPFMYFISIIVFCGGIGVWISFYQKNFDLANISTYIFALISSLMVDLILNKDDAKYKDKAFMMCIICCFIFIMSFAVAAVALSKGLLLLKWYLGVTALISAWYLWWILSSNDIKLGPTRQEIRDSTIGSDPSASLKGKGLSEL